MRIFYDVDTQNDFMNKGGALYVPGAEEIKPNLAILTNYAEQNRIPVVGSVDIHFGTEEYKAREGELKLWGGPFPNHCMIGTRGQEKIDATTLNGKYPEKGGKWPASLYIHHHIGKTRISEEEIQEALEEITHVPKYKTQNGLYFEKQSYDVFTNPNLKVFLELADVKQAVVYGVATDYCVRAAVLGMQKQGVQCYVVEDAIKAVNIDFNGNPDPEFGKKALEEMAKAGAKFVTTKDVLEDKI